MFVHNRPLIDIFACPLPDLDSGIIVVVVIVSYIPGPNYITAMERTCITDVVTSDIIQVVSWLQQSAK